MTSQGHVSTALLKKVNTEFIGAFFICLHLKMFCASILETSRSELRDLNQHKVKSLIMIATELKA